MKSEAVPLRAIQAKRISHALEMAVVAIVDIDATDRLRPIDPAKVQLIKDSILAFRRKDGAESSPAPITVRRLKNGKYRLVSGAHRLAACRQLGDAMIEVIIRDLDDLQARLMEIDENLCRAELNALDRASFLAERDRIWREMYPEHTRGKVGAKVRWHGLTENTSFGDDFKEKVGLSPRSIQMDVRLYRLLATTPGVLDRLRGTWLEDHQGQLKALAKVDDSDRAAVLDLLFRKEEPSRSIADALATLKGTRKPTPKPDDKAFTLFTSLWARAGAKLRNRILDHLDGAGALDTYANGAGD